MEMDERKLRILQAIIDDYILTAVPVGSRTISKKYDMGLSSATIRNEMSDLEELGYLDQPHVSAGRYLRRRPTGFMWMSCSSEAGFLRPISMRFGSISRAGCSKWAT